MSSSNCLQQVQQGFCALALSPTYESCRAAWRPTPASKVPAGGAQEFVQMRTADGHRGVMGDQPVFDRQATCLPANPLDRQENRECPTHW